MASPQHPEKPRCCKLDISPCPAAKKEIFLCIRKIKAKFKANPTIFYACSIVASWAGVGSLMNFRTIALRYGAVPAIIWAVFNSLACITFGLFADRVPSIRRIMQSKVMFYFIGFLTVFQTWTQMSGIYEIFGDTPIGTTGGTLIVYGTCLVFLFMLLKEGMIRNVLSDGFSWVVVYGLLAVVVIAALVYTHGAFVNIDPGLTAAGIQTGLYKGFLLLPGPFTYPYYYSLFSYNDKNEDGTQHGNMKKSFVLAGVMFGVYMVLAALLTWVNFSPLLNTLKAILITIIALSSLDCIGPGAAAVPAGRQSAGRSRRPPRRRERRRVRHHNPQPCPWHPPVGADESHCQETH